MSFTATEVQAMQLAMEAARQARAAGDTPFGATLVSSEGEILHTSPNRQNSTGDCTAHAEVVLVREATQRFGPERLHEQSYLPAVNPALCAAVPCSGRGSNVWCLQPARKILVTLWEGRFCLHAALRCWSLHNLRCA